MISTCCKILEDYKTQIVSGVLVLIFWFSILEPVLEETSKDIFSDLITAFLIAIFAVKYITNKKTDLFISSLYTEGVLAADSTLAAIELVYLGNLQQIEIAIRDWNANKVNLDALLFSLQGLKPVFPLLNFSSFTRTGKVLLAFDKDMATKFTKNYARISFEINICEQSIFDLRSILKSPNVVQDNVKDSLLSYLKRYSELKDDIHSLRKFLDSFSSLAIRDLDQVVESHEAVEGKLENLWPFL